MNVILNHAGKRISLPTGLFQVPPIKGFRNKFGMTVIIIILVLISIKPTFAQTEPVPFSKLFHNFGEHFIGSFTNNYGINHLTGIALTYGMVESGMDWEIHKFTSKHKGVQYAGFPSVIIGGLVPLILPASLYYYAGSEKDYQLQNTALALGQAAILGWTISSLYKAVSGREPPSDFQKEETKKDYSNDFNFGFMERGIFDGWPSGHTMTAFAMATTLVELYPENETIKYCAYTYAAVIGVGISLNIHWASDAVAGALIGYAIGKTVGHGFKEKAKEQSSLIISPALRGINVTWIF